jgi:5-methylcytosine-specific restriction endonuclease McrA
MSFLGKHHSKEIKKKIANANRRRKFSEETKRKISKIKKGKKKSEETKKKMSEARKGKHRTEETKRKISEAHRGEKSHFWKGGISYEPYSIDWTETLKRSIRERDHYICQVCWDYGNTVHHTNYDKKNCNPENLITLCNSCNSKVNHNRKKWIRFFMRGNLLK